MKKYSGMNDAFKVDWDDETKLYVDMLKGTVHKLARDTAIFIMVILALFTLFILSALGIEIPGPTTPWWIDGILVIFVILSIISYVKSFYKAIVLMGIFRKYEKHSVY